MDKFVVATTPRTGSTVLCCYLAYLGLGRPWEWLGAKCLDPQRLIDENLVNGVFGAKVFADHATRLGAKFDQYFADAAFIYLTRSNKVAQAISAYRARTTGQYHSWQPKRFYSPTYSHDGIKRELVQIAVGEAQWERFFERHDITPIKHEYHPSGEDSETMASTVDALTCALGVEVSEWLRSWTPTSKIMRDKLSEKWERRFAEEVYDAS